MRAELICLVALAIISSTSQNCGFCQSQAHEAKHDAKVEALAKEYNSFGRQEWKKRRDFCVRLIDEGVISDGAKAEDIRRIFRRDIFEHGRTDQHPAGGFV